MDSRRTMTNLSAGSRKARRWRYLLSAALVIGLAFAYAAITSLADTQPTGKRPVVLESQAFLLVDDQGLVRAAYRLDEGKLVGLHLFDRTGRPRGTLSFSESDNHAALSLWDGGGRQAVGFSASPQGTGLHLYTTIAEKGITAGVANPQAGSRGSIGVSITGTDGKPRILFGEHRNGGILAAADQTGDRVLLEAR